MISILIKTYVKSNKKKDAKLYELCLLIDSLPNSKRGDHYLKGEIYKHDFFDYKFIRKTLVLRFLIR